GMAAAARAVALAGLGTAELWTGALDAAEEHLQAGQAAALGAGLDDLRLDCLSKLALLQAIGGRLSLAARTGEAAVGLTGDAPAVAGALLALAWVHYQRDDLVLTGGFLERAAEQAGGAHDLPLRAAVRLLRGRLRWAEGDPAGALAELGAARHELGVWDPPGLLTHWLSTTEAELRLAAGDPGPATALLGSFGTGDPVEGPEAVARAGLQLALDDPAAALGTLSPFLDAAGPATRLDTSIRAWLLHALASHALDQADQAAASLRQAIDLAEPEEHRRTFLDAGAPGRSWTSSPWRRSTRRRR
ncbi:MAG TPA: hypothetical protein VG411_05060, partial [Actinomycetota bacterium]|nr:hypothetical protein [Actinomycetota bacterium]